ncbi:hypothetical protein CDL12_08509 [Handroanthus impetiginosus]|uniref:Uncharacterized protein n=1 Tax=Handroanthus impetiginosus TaxID=429701 RepID=A0A2G9HMZ9_9LAMI|nr:hypothetical protein CDL12_08509 [Handroanthus impetiginosus]
MEDTSPCGTQGKNSEAISGSITSSGDQNPTDNLSSTGLSDNQQINEWDKTNDATDPQKISVEEHDIEEEEAGCEEEEDNISVAKSEPETDITTEPQRKSDDEEEQIKEDDSEPHVREPFTAPTTASNLVSSAKGSSENGGKPAKRRVTWSPHLVRVLTSDDETDKSDDQEEGAGENKQENGGKGTDANEGGEA